METPDATPELAWDIWKRLDYWQRRAGKLGASKTHNNRTSFDLSGNTGVLRCMLHSEGARVFWLSLAGHPEHVDVYPYEILNADDRSLPPLSAVAGHALKDMLERDAVEVVPPVKALYGFVVNNRIVAITFTKDVGESSLTDRTQLGLEEETYVADSEAFNRLCPATDDRVVWYSQFWELKERNAVVELSERMYNLPGEVWRRHIGMETWLEVEATDGRLPAFIVGSSYRLWLVASNTPALQVEANKQASLRQPLREWF
jgi:hypothetical protein